MNLDDIEAAGEREQRSGLRADHLAFVGLTFEDQEFALAGIAHWLVVFRHLDARQLVNEVRFLVRRD